MNDYNFWKDFFDTYQSLSDLMKFAWLVVPPTFLISLVVLILRYRLAGKRVDHGVDGELVYSVYRGADQQLQVFRHDRQLPCWEEREAKDGAWHFVGPRPDTR